jgi:hypothetical protein
MLNALIRFVIFNHLVKTFFFQSKQVEEIGSAPQDKPFQDEMKRDKTKQAGQESNKNFSLRQRAFWNERLKTLDRPYPYVNSLSAS